MALKVSQSRLPIEEAEASFAERKNRLAIALLRVDCDLHLAQFVLWVFNATHGGEHGELRKTYDELASKPLGLCCSRSKARSTVELAADLGFVTVRRTRDSAGGQSANCYQVNWPGIASIVRCGRWRPDVATEQGGVATKHPGASTEQGDASWRHHIRNNTFPAPSNHNPDPDRSTETDPIRDLLITEHPVLAEAATRSVEPLDPGGLAGHAFAPLQQSDLESTGRMLQWFRRQLGLRSPLTHSTEADLLLVVGAALYASREVAERVRRNRVALFVDTVKRRKWRKAVPHINDARRLIDSLVATHPEVLGPCHAS